METRITLATLLSGVDAHITGDADTEITGIAYDSRQVEPGDAFVAVSGFVHDGLHFVADAVDAGAVAVITEAEAGAVDLPSPAAAWATVPDARSVLAPLAARFYGRPSEELTLVGVTGTNGKTTVSALLEAILAAKGPTGRWSTTAVSIAGDARPAQRTTPEGPDLQKVLRDMVDAGCWAAAIEVSSHALALHRVDGTHFDAAVFTNLSSDHLDFHHDMDAYLDAKSLLFERLDAGALAVLNVCDPASAVLAQRTRARIVGYGWKTRPLTGNSAPAADARDECGNSRLRSAASSRDHVPTQPVIDVPTYWISRWAHRGAGSAMRLETPGGVLDLDSPLFGPANAENLAGGVATALELGLSVDDLIAPIAAFRGPRGRLQRLVHGQPFAVLIDFAHTPAALEAALAAARDLAGAHRVIVVFGCGGDRDRAKRPVMGRIAAQAADQVLVTSDNPRSETPEAIIDQIVGGIPEETCAQVERDGDRRSAIERALDRARPGDCVLIAGKGHETEQVFADRTIEFDDAAVASAWLERHYPRGGQPADRARTGESHR